MKSSTTKIITFQVENLYFLKIETAEGIKLSKTYKELKKYGGSYYTLIRKNIMINFLMFYCQNLAGTRRGILKVGRKIRRFANTDHALPLGPN